AAHGLNILTPSSLQVCVIWSDEDTTSAPIRLLQFKATRLERAMQDARQPPVVALVVVIKNLESENSIWFDQIQEATSLIEIEVKLEWSLCLGWLSLGLLGLGRGSRLACILDGRAARFERSGHLLIGAPALALQALSFRADPQ